MKFTGERMIPSHNKGEDVWAEHYTRYIFAAQFIKNKIVLDIACGSGYGTYYLAQSGASKVIGVDISPETIDYAKKKYPSSTIEYKIGDARNIPLPDHSVDIVVSYETIEHMPDYQKFLQETVRVLKKDGLCIISTPNKDIIPSGNIFHIKELTTSEFETALKKHYQYFDLLFQDNWVTSTILDSKSINSLSFTKQIEPINVYKVDDKNFKGSIYTIALCSNQPIAKHFNQIASLHEFTMGIDYLTSQASTTQAQLHQQIDQLHQQIDQLRIELDRIYKSRGWKVIQKVRKIKSTIIKKRP